MPIEVYLENAGCDVSEPLGSGAAALADKEPPRRRPADLPAAFRDAPRAESRSTGRSSSQRLHPSLRS